MKENHKNALVGLLGGLGLILFLIGIFSDAYSAKMGLLYAIIVWVITGVVAKFVGHKTHLEHHRPTVSYTAPVRTRVARKPAKKKATKKKATKKKATKKKAAKKKPAKKGKA